MTTTARPLTEAEQHEERETFLAEVAARYRRDPLGFTLAAFPWGEPGTELAAYRGPRRWQRRTLERIRYHLEQGHTPGGAVKMATASGHGIGKSALVSFIAHWAMVTQEDCRGIITANTERQLLTKTQPEFAKWHRLSLYSHWFHLTATSYYSTDPDHAETWRLDFHPWSEQNTEAFAGLHNEGKRLFVLFDEASKIADKVWDVTEGALTDASAEIFWFAFGNPTRATGRFRECWRKYRHRWDTQNIDSRTVEGISHQQILEWVQDRGEDSDFVKVRVRGIFPSAGFRQFIGQDLIDAARGRELRPEQYKFAPVIIGVDPAWTGEDDFVIVMRQGLYSRVLATFPKNDDDVWMAGVVARFEDELGADAVFIDGGFGTGIVSVGRNLGRTWRIVWFSEKPYREGSLNKRAEMYDDCRIWLREGGAIPDHEALATDLAAVETSPRVDGKLALRSKEEMKTEGLASPNHSDALVLTFAHPVVSRKLAHMGADAPPSRSITDYDPRD